MSTFVWDQGGSDDIDLSDALFREYSCDGALTGMSPPHASASCLSPVARTVPYAPYIPNAKALGMYETCDSGFDRIAGYRSSVPTTDTQVPVTSFLPAFDSLSGVQHLWPPPTTQHSSFPKDISLTAGVGNDLARCSSQTSSPPWSLASQKPDNCSLRKGSSGLLKSTVSRELLRHTPYSTGADGKTRSDSSTSAHRCEWFDGTKPCGARVMASKHAIGQHLHTAHAIKLKADKMLQVCRWVDCQKSMRKESIARHILGVHMQDKVLCPGCGSAFARTDSMQRHQRAQCPNRGNIDASDCRSLKSRN